MGTVIATKPADPAAMQRLRDNWQRDLDTLNRDLRLALKRGHEVAAEGVRVAHLIDDLREKVDQRSAQLAKYRT